MVCKAFTLCPWGRGEIGGHTQWFWGTPSPVLHHLWCGVAGRILQCQRMNVSHPINTWAPVFRAVSALSLPFGMIQLAARSYPRLRSLSTSDRARCMPEVSFSVVLELNLPGEEIAQQVEHLTSVWPTHIWSLAPHKAPWVLPGVIIKGLQMWLPLKNINILVYPRPLWDWVLLRRGQNLKSHPKTLFQQPD